MTRYLSYYTDYQIAKLKEAGEFHYDTLVAKSIIAQFNNKEIDINTTASYFNYKRMLLLCKSTETEESQPSS